MADFNQINQFGSAKPSRSGEGMSCAECEAMLTDFIDGTLNAKDRAAFDLHIATCKECSQMLADAQRGAALLEMLKHPRPEPSVTLLERIVAHTSGVQTGLSAKLADGISLATNPVVAESVLGLTVIAGGAGATQRLVPAPVAGDTTLPMGAGGNVLPFRARPARTFNLQAITRTMMQPRLAMTAAMAFFSIALTLNLTGVHLSELKASDLKPSSIRHTFYQADASLVRYYDNLRVVYELESRVNGLKQASDSDSPSVGKTGSGGDATGDSGNQSPEDKPNGSGNDGNQKKTQPKAGSGTSQHRSPLMPEFKLAEELSSQQPAADASAAVSNRVFTESKTTQSKEMLQEGELV